MSKKPQDQEDSSKVFSIDTLAYKAQISSLETEVKNLVAQNVGYSQTVDQLLKQLEDKTNQIMHLEKMLKGVVPTIGEASPFLVSDEEVIAEYQLKRLKAAAMIRDLTLDEIRQYDLLVKNKRLAQGAATEIPGKVKTKEKPLAELIHVAKKPLSSE